MKEKLKTLTMVILVFTSIFLINLLSQDTNLEFKQKAETVIAPIENYTLEDMLVPHKAFIRTEDEAFIVYDVAEENLFNTAKRTLSKILTNNTMEVFEYKKEDNEFKHPDIVFYYPYEISLNILIRAYHIENENQKIDIIKNIDKIGFYLYDDEFALILSNNEKDYLIKSKDIDMSEFILKIKKILENGNINRINKIKLDYQSYSENTYWHEKIEMKMPITYVSNQVVLMSAEDKEKLAEKFFEVDKYYIRQIKEDNGSVIFFYNSNVLKINPNSLLSYYSPLRNEVKERNLYLSLNTASNFIAKNAFLPSGLILDEIIPIESGNSKGYRFIFSHKNNGLKVFENNMESSKDVVMEVFNNEVRSFKQIYKIKDQFSYTSYEENSSMLSYSEIINKNMDFLKSQYTENNEGTDNKQISNDQILDQIINIYPAYYNPNLKLKNERLLPVWTINIFGKNYLFNAYNGVLMNIN